MHPVRWLAVFAAFVLAVGLAAPAPAAAAPSDPDRATSVKKKKKSKRKSHKSTTRRCTGSGNKKRCRRVATFQGHGVWSGSLQKEPLARPSGDVWLRAENLGEEVRVNIYKPDGSFDDAALAQLDELFRCKQTGEVRAVRSELYEQLSRIYDHFGSKRIYLVSGFRFAERDSSRHFHASAMDIRIPGVSTREMYKFAESLDAGNMGIGIYPTSGFIHVDYRAPGDRSYRWTDYSPNSANKKAKRRKSRTQPARKPTS